MTVYKDEERGTWYFITRLGGKQVKRRGFETEKAALLAEAKMEEDYEDQIVDEENIRFDHVAKEYMAWYEKRRKYSSYTKIKSITNTHLITRFGKKRIKSIRPRDITLFQDDLIADGRKPSHIKKIHTVLSAIFKFAIRNEYTTENPASIVGNVNMEENKIVNYWTLDEFKAFIKHVDDPLYHALFMTLYYSGMRKGELLALTWGDIDFNNNTINVDKTEYNRVTTSPKTPSSIRVILMPTYVMNLLRKIEIQIKPKKKYVVFGEIMTSISTSTLDIRYAKYIKRSGVKKIRLHDFRHSHASYLINKGIIISVVAARLGHGDVATTLNTYSHLFPTTEKEAVLTMENDFKVAQVIEFKKEN